VRRPGGEEDGAQVEELARADPHRRGEAARRDVSLAAEEEGEAAGAMPPHGLEKLAPDVEEVAAAAGRATLRSASRRRGQRREARHGRRGPRRRGRRGRGRDGEWRRGGALGQALEGRLLVRLGREVDKEAARDGSLDRLDSNPLAVVDRLRVCCAVGGEVEDVVRYLARGASRVLRGGGLPSARGGAARVPPCRRSRRGPPTRTACPPGRRGPSRRAG